MSITLRSRRGPIGTSWHAITLREKGETLLGPSRVARGKADARAGHVQWLDVDTSVARGAVQDGLGHLHEARIELPALRPGDREAFLHVARAHPELPARFAAGEYPEAIERELAQHELSLLPSDASELSHDCSCLDWPGPCRHVSALLYVLVEAVDESPLLLLTLRGFTLEDLVAPLEPSAAVGTAGSAGAAGPAGSTGSAPSSPSADEPFHGAGPETEEGASGTETRSTEPPDAEAPGADASAAPAPGVFDPHHADAGRLAEVMGEEVAEIIHAFYCAAPRPSHEAPPHVPDPPLQ